MSAPQYIVYKQFGNFSWASDNLSEGVKTDNFMETLSQAVDMGDRVSTSVEQY